MKAIDIPCPLTNLIHSLLACLSQTCERFRVCRFFSPLLKIKKSGHFGGKHQSVHRSRRQSSSVKAILECALLVFTHVKGSKMDLVRPLRLCVVLHYMWMDLSENTCDYMSN